MRSNRRTALVQSKGRPKVAIPSQAGFSIAGPLRKLRLLPLVAATYFMVSGGPYGLEDVIGQAGYERGLLLLLLIPVFWSLPTALMIGELASAMPEEGGFYVWVRRALGPFWGFQEAWLSLTASLFDMAIYPTLSVAYLSQLAPELTAGHRGLYWSLAIVIACVVWNLQGAYSVGQGSVWMSALLLLPFAGIVFLGIRRIQWASVELWLRHPHAAHALTAKAWAAPADGSIRLALLFVLWNLMGWDNASTVAREVANPQRNYIRAMLIAVSVVTFSYVVPIAVVALAGVSAADFTTGSWVATAVALAGGNWLGWTVLAGGAVTGVAMFNALTLSYARVPAAMAKDGLLPRVLALHMGNGVPWVAVCACAVAWTLCLGFSFERLLELDVTLYGLSLILEFVALVVLRFRQPALPRPYRVPGGIWVAIALGLCPTALILFAIYAARDEQRGHWPALLFSMGVVLAGPVVYLAMRLIRARSGHLRISQQPTNGL